MNVRSTYAPSSSSSFKAKYKAKARKRGSSSGPYTREAGGVGFSGVDETMDEERGVAGDAWGMRQTQTQTQTQTQVTTSGSRRGSG